MTQSTNQPGAADLSNRMPEEIFAHHGQALAAEDLDATMMDETWSNDACLWWVGIAGTKTVFSRYI